ncbi:MAG: LPS export ABC transporter periplasmic protein LptC [Neisseriaceae bacterium]|jgi:LPS export ABC transporter protein LptC
MQKFYSPRVFRFLTIVFMASLCLLFNQLTKINFIKIELPKDSPEYKANNAKGIIYNKTGGILYELDSQNVWQFPNNERVFMANLHAKVHSESEPNIIKYNLTANDGWLDYNKRLGFLGINSILTVYNPDPKQNIAIYGKEINLDLNRNFFNSNEDVKAVQNNSIITSHGFNYDNNTSILKLLSNVHIVYNQ